MKQKARPVSKIPTTGKNTNQKRDVTKKQGFDLGGSLLKMNEFTLIILGALVVTVLVFFLFFRSPDPGEGEVGSNGTAENQFADSNGLGLEKRIAELEVSVARLSSSPATASPGDTKGVAAVDQRVTRLETATTLKLDAVLERLAKLEKQLAGLKKVSVAAKVPVKSPKPVAAVSKKPPVKKKAVESKKKANLFHTVKKGETLWSISQKYKTSVAAVRKLNNMTAKDKIYPGNNILVRQN